MAPPKDPNWGYPLSSSKKINTLGVPFLESGYFRPSLFGVYIAPCYCPLEAGEVRVIMVESPQFHNGRLAYRIHDAKDGIIDTGEFFIKDLKDEMPWPELKAATG